MKKLLIVLLITTLLACSARLIGNKSTQYNAEALRDMYSKPRNQWPTPNIDSGVVWSELGMVPGSPLSLNQDSIRQMVALGKTLFFDPRLSSSNQISCSSCHVPDLSWTDGRAKSVGHDQQMNKRNSPSILNVWYYQHLFWDGRSHSLADQAFSPINSEIEMNSSMPDVIRKLRRIKGYSPLFEKAFGSADINPETLTEALATFQKSIVSNPAAFDDFLSGNKNAMTDEAVSGLHIFRTKAGCMNCHHGNLLSDNDFHNTGIGTADKGLNGFSGLEADMRKFKTPSLRDVVRTRPWMHNGSLDDLAEIIELYNQGMPSDSTNWNKDKRIKKLGLTDSEKRDLLAFLHAITAAPAKVDLPKLP